MDMLDKGQGKLWIGWRSYWDTGRLREASTVRIAFGYFPLDAI